MVKCQGFSWDTLTEQAICRGEGTSVQEAHTGVCVQEQHLFLPTSLALCCLFTLLNEEETFTCVFDHMGARLEFWCYHVNSGNNIWSLPGFTKAIQHHM